MPLKGRGGQKKKPPPCPPPSELPSLRGFFIFCFFCLPPSRLSSLGGDVASDGDFLIFEGNRYSRKGFLFKSFAMSAVVSVGLALNPDPNPALFTPDCFPSRGTMQRRGAGWEKG